MAQKWDRFPEKQSNHHSSRITELNETTKTKTCLEVSSWDEGGSKPVNVGIMGTADVASHRCWEAISKLLDKSVMISPYSIGVSCVIFFGYIFQTSLIQYFFYCSSRSSVQLWKIQHTKQDHVGQFYFLPILSNKPNRAPLHGPVMLLNLCIASLVAGFTTECSVRQWNKMEFYPPTLQEAGVIAMQFLLAVVYQCVVEYYWHRLMHTKLFYASFHKYHHWYKSPEPWDDMYIHPLEAFGYYCILYGPPFLFRIHCWAFLGYMVVMGVCGILDHSGVRVEVPGLYNTEDHDNHHLRFEVNYSFPFPFMDLLHGTFHGSFWGRTYTCSRSRAGVSGLGAVATVGAGAQGETENKELAGAASWKSREGAENSGSREGEESTPNTGSRDRHARERMRGR